MECDLELANSHCSQRGYSLVGKTDHGQLIHFEDSHDGGRHGVLWELNGSTAGFEYVREYSPEEKSNKKVNLGLDDTQTSVISSSLH